ncbi:MAG: hypothetical protein IKZ67_07170 [Paludibacteraceae bacterium]|nr:hypothetical protein [Paludibacteraceae bacterium]
MRKIIYITILLIFTSSVTLLSKKREDVPQKPERMEQREKTTELNYFENPRYQNKPNVFVAKDGNYVYNSSLYVNEYTPSETFHKIQKLYYKDGSLKSIVTSTLLASIKSEEYDENGFLIEKIDYELGKNIEGMDYASFFEKEGWYNRSTGQTAFREDPYPLNTGEFTFVVLRRFNFHSNPSTIYVTINNINNVPQQFLDKYGTTEENGNKYLDYKSSRDGNLTVYYIIDIQTGTYKVGWDYIEEIE